MGYKVAGIDVHKKVLMVVVCEVSAPEWKPERRRFGTTPSRDNRHNPQNGRHRERRRSPKLGAVRRADFARLG